MKKSDEGFLRLLEENLMMIVAEVKVEVKRGRMMQSGSLVLSSDALCALVRGRFGPNRAPPPCSAQHIITDRLSRAYFLYLESINAIN